MGSGWSGIGLGLVSSGIGAFGAYRQAQASNEAAEYNASQQQMMADNVRTRGQFDMTLLRLRNKQNLSALTQDVSNGGVDLSSPSAVRMLSAQRGMDVQGEKIQAYNTEIEATGYERQASLTRSRRANPWAAAGQSLLGGVMQTYQQYNQYRMYTRPNARTSLGLWP